MERERDTYGNGIDMEDGNLGGEIVKLICREGFGKGRLDELMEVCRSFQSRHCGDVKIGKDDQLIMAFVLRWTFYK